LKQRTIPFQRGDSPNYHKKMDVKELERGVINRKRVIIHSYPNSLPPPLEVWWAKGIEEYLRKQTTGYF